MLKNFSYYFKKGNSLSFNVLMKNIHNYFSYLLLNIIGILANITVITQPLFNIARLKLLRNIENKSNISLNQIMSGISNPKYFWKGLLYTLIIDAILSIVLVPVFIIFFIFILSMEDLFFRNTMTVILIIVAIISLFVMLLISISFSPSFYLLEKNPNISLKELLTNSLKVSKVSSTKFMYFKLLLIYSLIILGYFIVMFSIPLLFILIGKNMVFTIIGLVIVLIFLLIFIIFIPWFTLSLDISTYLLIKDAASSYFGEENNKIDFNNFNYEELIDDFFKEE